MNTSTSAVEQAVQARIAAARWRAENERKRRAEFAAARRHGIPRRHAQKLRHLANRKTYPGR
ncbi:hypothetical protein [Streptomyces sp. NPDC058758]|uniref:hypothetical protein n=1 Tax=Streptomyces sp. NPDC058758 TaxID=3346627 RepID=UPI0036A1B75B